MATMALLYPAALQAQSFRVESASLEDGADGVALIDSIHFHFNRRLPFNSQFTGKFHWEPRRKAFRRYVFLDADRQNPRFTIEHEEETDYAVYVYGVRSENGAAMERPFTLNYTTASSTGSHSVDGAVSMGERAITTPSRARALEHLIARALPSLTRHLSPDSMIAEQHILSAASRSVAFKKAGADAQNDRPLASLAREALSPPELDRTVVLLLDDYDFNRYTWSVRAASALDDDHRFSFSHVREGTYWPVAISFADVDGELIGAYGFYDADGDLTPDPIDVAGSIDDLDIALFTFSTATARQNVEVARDRAALTADTQRLLSISTHPVGKEGEAHTWRYTFYQPDQDVLNHVLVGPIDVRTFESEPTDDQRDQAALPNDFIDSDEALSIAVANGGATFMETQGEGNTSISITGGDLNLLASPPVSGAFWLVRYETISATGHLDVLVDMRTGEVLTGEEPEPTQPTFRLDQNYPNPFTEKTTIAFELEEPGPVTLRVYDTLGRHVATLLDADQPAGGSTVSWDATNLPSGLYFYRLSAGGKTQTRRMTYTK